MADDPFSGETSYTPFSKPEAVAAALADGLIHYALHMAKSDRTRAIAILEKVNPHILKMLASLDVTDSDYKRVVELINKVESLVADAEFPVVAPTSNLRH